MFGLPKIYVYAFIAVVAVGSYFAWKASIERNAVQGEKKAAEERTEKAIDGVGDKAEAAAMDFSACTKRKNEKGDVKWVFEDQKCVSADK